MIADVHFNFMLNQRLQPLITSGKYDDLTEVLKSLSNAQFRIAGYMIGERYAVEMDNEGFWAVTTKLVSFNAKAFLVTMLKALRVRMLERKSSVRDRGMVDFCSILNDIDRQKTLKCILPDMESIEDIELLFRLLGYENRSEWIPYLLHSASIPCYYELFSSLRYVEEDHGYLVRIASFLIKKGDTLSFNLASLIKAYFGLDELKGTFSLNLKPYQLSRLENSFHAFSEAMRI